MDPAREGQQFEHKVLHAMVRQATRWLSWYGVGLASADRLPVVVRIRAGRLGSLKCDPPKGNGRRPKKKKLHAMVRQHGPAPEGK